MRIISGERKGQPLIAVPGVKTRPTTDKVKESMFNIIGPYFSGGSCLDLYAGSGGLGLEALSRGVERAIFVDQSKQAIQVIKQNIKTCKYNDRSEVYRNDAGRALKALIKRKTTFSYVFLDPPYDQQNIENEARLLADSGLLEKEAIVICEHGREHTLPDSIGTLSLQRQETYGETTITIYHYSAEE